MNHILVVDDDPTIRLMMRGLLRGDDCVVDMATSGEQALAMLKKNRYDLMLLDLRMEPMSGLDVMAQARQQDADLVIIILTAYSSVESAAEAVRQGAFDYLFKTTEPEAIQQRVKDGLQRHEQAERLRRVVEQIELLRTTLNETPGQSASVNRRFVHSGLLKIDLRNRTATLDGRALDLTDAEFGLLLRLVTSAPLPVEVRQLVTALGYEASSIEASEIVRRHICNLRKKLEPNPHHPRYIKAVRHASYLWSAS